MGVAAAQYPPLIGTITTTFNTLRAVLSAEVFSEIPEKATSRHVFYLNVLCSHSLRINVCEYMCVCVLS